MPRSRTIRRPKKKNQKKAWLPEKVQAFIARRLVDICAFMLIVTGAFGLLSLLSYSAADPSWNTAGQALEGSVQNWGGGFGAWLADMLMQPMGAGALMLVSGILLLGIRTWFRHRLSPFSLRSFALVSASLMLCVAMSKQETAWIPSGYWGGALGILIANKIGGYAGWVSSLIGPFSLVGAVAAYGYALALTKAEIVIALSILKDVIANVIKVVANTIITFRNWINYYNDPAYQPKPLFKLSIRLPKIEMPSRAGAISTPVAMAQQPETHEISASPVATPSSAPQAVTQSQPTPPANIPVVSTAKRGASETTNQTSFNLDNPDWKFPPIDLLDSAPPAELGDELNEDALRKNAQLLQTVLADFKIEGEVVSIHPGPVVTLYELEPAPGTKSSRVISLSDDIARSMSAISVRCAVVPGRNVIGIEIPNKTRQIVFMRELLMTRLFEKTKAHLPLVLGKDIGGQPILADLAKMPHLLVAGTTGSGKSVAVNTMILSLLYRLPPEKCRMIMIDPKMLELSVYDDIPHLLSPVVTEPGKAVVALKWAVQEMENRYRSMSKLGVRSIEGYNARMREAIEKGEELMERVATGFDETGAPTYEERPMALEEVPYIVVIVDEFADLMLVAGKDVENAIQRLAQMARAAGIHLIMATQRPSVDVITGVIKANFPTRISFQVTSKIDSRTILGEGGAEQLLGMGDMLYMAPGGRIQRVHGPFVSDKNVDKVVKCLKKQAKPAYLDAITDEAGDFGNSAVMDAMFGDSAQGSGGSSVDELYDHAVAIVAREGKASTSFIQRHLQIGYNRAARIMEEMERQGVVSPASGTGKRTILVQDHSNA